MAEQHRVADYAEVYYGHETQIDTEEMADTVLSAVTNLIESERFGRFAQQASAATEPWIIDPEGFGETQVEGLKAYCKVDFMIPKQDHLHIFDWKTVKEREGKHCIQMRGYAPLLPCGTHAQVTHRQGAQCGPEDQLPVFVPRGTAQWVCSNIIVTISKIM